MNRTPILRSWLAALLAAVLITLSFTVAPARAGMVPTEEVVRSAAVLQERDRVIAFFEREDVRRQLMVLGVDRAEAMARVSGLTDAEISGIAGEIDRLPAGQDAASAIIGAVLAVFLVFIITDILGFTDVFPFVSSIEE